MSLQHVTNIAATRRGDKPLLVYRSGDKLLQQLTAHFVAATSRRKSNQFEIVRLVAATKFCCSEKDFYKYSLVRTKRFVAVTCRRDLSPSVYQPEVKHARSWKLFRASLISIEQTGFECKHSHNL